MDKSSGENIVPELAIEMRNSIAFIAGERSWGMTRQRWLERAAKQAGISYRSARALFYLEYTPRADLVERVREAARRRRNDTLRDARNEYAKLVEQISRIETILRVSDQDFHSPEINALRSMAGRSNRTVD